MALSCDMPLQEELFVLVLNASLKHGDTPSNTEEVTERVLRAIRDYCPIQTETVRLSDRSIPAGLGFRESDDDEWPDIVEKIKKADVVIFATPIWWGGRSSLMQKAIERMDAFDEEYIQGGRSILLNKAAGIVVTGSEDGAQATIASIMEVLTFMNFTLPPQCATYWVGEVGMDSSSDAERRRKNKAVEHMAKITGRNLAYYAQLIKKHPLIDL